MKILLHLILCFVSFGSLSARELYQTRCERKFEPTRQTEVQRRVRMYMDAVVYPKVSLSHVPLSDAVEWVCRRIARYARVSDPADRHGISIFLKQRPNAREFVSVSLRSATLPQVLDAICQRPHYVWCVEPMTLSITPREQMLPVISSRPSA